MTTPLAVLTLSGWGYAELRHDGAPRSCPVSYGTDLHGALSAKPRELLDDPAASPGEVALIIRTPTGSGRLVGDAARRTYDGPELPPALSRQITQSLL